MQVIIGMPPIIIIMGMPIAIIPFIASQRSFMRAIIEASVGTIFMVMPSLVISQLMLHITGIMPGIIMGIIIGMPFIMPMPPMFMPPIIGIIMGIMPFIIGMPFMPCIMGIMPFIIGMPFMPCIMGIMPFIIGIEPMGMLFMGMLFMGIEPMGMLFMGMLFIGLAFMALSVSWLVTRTWTRVASPATDPSAVSVRPTRFGAVARFFPLSSRRLRFRTSEMPVSPRKTALCHHGTVLDGGRRAVALVADHRDRHRP